MCANKFSRPGVKVLSSSSLRPISKAAYMTRANSCTTCKIDEAEWSLRFYNRSQTRVTFDAHTKHLYRQSSLNESFPKKLRSTSSMSRNFSPLCHNKEFESTDAHLWIEEFLGHDCRHSTFDPVAMIIEERLLRKRWLRWSYSNWTQKDY